MDVIKICPKPTELCQIKTNVICPEDGCKRVFLSTANLDMHILKHHKKEKVQKKDGPICHYHCPVKECVYNVESNQFFKCLKYLKQHYLKVHAEKIFRCEKCAKGFSTEAAVKHHSRICGVKFTCSCNNSYDSYEALLTHAKRMSHTFDEKYRLYGKKLSSIAADKEKRATNSVDCREFQPVSAAITVPVHFLAAIALSELSGKGLGTAVDKEVQTDTHARTKKGPSPFKSYDRGTKRRMTAQTQTGSMSRNKRPKISAQTQTIGDYILKKAMKEADIHIARKNQKVYAKQTMYSAPKKRRKSMETQTMNHVNSKLKSQNKHLNGTISSFTGQYQHLDGNYSSLSDFPSSNVSLSANTNSYRIGVDVGLPDLWVSQKNTSGTQTSPVAMSALIDQEELLSHSVTQTDLNLAFLESETCESSSSNIHSSSQAIQHLHRYFEDNSNYGFSTDISNVPSALGPQLTSSCATNMENNLGSLTDESGYSPSQMDSFLTQHRKIIFDENRSCSIETQTELDFTDSFLSECGDDGDTSFTISSTIETQTTEEFPSFDHLLYTNMCTQTSDESFYSELGFVNIQTQTAWPHFGVDDSTFVSAETQTALSGCPNASSSMSKLTNSETTHMETQTDVDELIAELSKQTSVDKLL